MKARYPANPAAALIQFLSRLIFTFDYRTRLKRYGSLWGGVALASITYFILVKGAKGAAFLDAEDVAWIRANTLSILIGMFAVSAVLLQVLQMVGVHILKLEERKEAYLLPLDEIREKLRDHVSEERMETAVEAEIERLRTEGEVEIPTFYNTVKTLDQVVDVDYYLPGCPPVPQQIDKAGLGPQYRQPVEVMVHGRADQRLTVMPALLLQEVVENIAF